MPPASSNDETLALQALAWTLAAPERATRLLDLTGMTPAGLRGSAGSRDTLLAVLGFLEAHEPDLVACCDALDCTPEAMVAARRRLEDA